MEREDFRRLLDAELHGEATPDERARLAEAVAADPELAREAAELRRLRALFEATPPATAPDGFRASVMAGVSSRTVGAPRPRLRLLRTVPWVAGVAAAALLAVMLGPWATGDRSVQQSTASVDEPAASGASVSLEYAGDDGDARARRAFDAEAGSTIGVTTRSRPRAEGAPQPAAPSPPGEAAPMREATGELKAEPGTAASDGDGADSSDEFGRRKAREKPLAGKNERDAVAEAETESADAGATGGRAAEPAVPPAAEAPPIPTADDGRSPAGPTGKEAGGAKDAGPEELAAGAADTSEDRAATTAFRPQAKPEKRYVVFEDEASARRFLASLQAAAADARRGSGTRGRPSSGSEDAGDGDASAPAGPTTGGGGGGAGTSGATASGAAPGSRSLAQAATPRVLGRVTLPATSEAAVRSLSRRPEGAGFARDVDPSVIAAAERLTRPGSDGGLAIGIGGGAGGAGEGAGASGKGKAQPDDAADRGEAAEDRADRPPAGEPASDPAPADPALADEGGAKRATTKKGQRARPESQVEIVIVVAPRGTVRTKGASPR